jgi:hypothetical protein
LSGQKKGARRRRFVIAGVCQFELFEPLDLFRESRKDVLLEHVRDLFRISGGLGVQQRFMADSDRHKVRGEENPGALDPLDGNDAPVVRLGDAGIGLCCVGRAMLLLGHVQYLDCWMWLCRSAACECCPGADFAPIEEDGF